jgi:hypothetical protein
MDNSSDAVDPSIEEIRAMAERIITDLLDNNHER